MPSFRNKPKISTGILSREKGAAFFQLNRYLPSKELADFIEHYWIVEWSLPEGHSHVQEVLPTLSVQLAFQLNTATIYGLKKGRFIQPISGTGRVAGVKFKPGGFYPFLKSSLHALGNRETDAYELLNIAIPSVYIPVTGGYEPVLEGIENFLLRLYPQKDEKMLLVQQIADTIITNRSILSIAQLATQFHLTIRTLERLFSSYAGISPKWGIKIFRLHEAVERIAGGVCPNWAQLAVDLGYFDQAHFIKDFRVIVGKTPKDYASECR